MSDFALRFGLALIVVIAACAAIFISRRNSAKSANVERNIEAFRREFQRSIDAAQAATIKTIRDNIFSIIKTINSTVKDLSDRLASLEERADETAAQIAEAHDLDIRLARLDQHADATATHSQHLDVRLAKLEGRADETAAHIVGTQKQSLEENERIAARLAGFEPNLMALSDQLSLLKKTIDATILREQDIKNSIEIINSGVINIEKRVDELFPRLVLGERALKDLGALISLFVKRLKRVNANSTDIAQRLRDLESHFRSKVAQLEERHSSILERKDGPSTDKMENPVGDATPKAAEGAVSTETTTGGENAGVFERPTTPGEESSSNESIVEGEDRSDNRRTKQHAT